MADLAHPDERLNISSSADGLQGSARTMAVIAVSLSVLLALLDYAIANVALPDIARDLKASASASIWVVNAYQLASLVSLLPLASLGNKVGFSRLCRAGIMVFMTSSLLCATATSLPMLAGARVLQGIGGACIMSVNIALLRFIYPHAEIGRGIALNGVVVAVGVALGPTAAAVILSVASWPWLFWVNLPLGALALIMAFKALPETPRSNQKSDTLGSFLCILGVGALVMGCDELSHHGNVALSVCLIVIGLGAGVVLVRREAEAPQPILPVDLLARPDFAVAFATGFLGFVASNFYIISMPFTLHDELGLSAALTGLLITPWPIGIMCAAPVVRRVADSVSAGVLSSIGLSVTATGFLLLWLLPLQPSVLDIAWRTALAGWGFGFFQPPNNRAMMVSVSHARAGGASGMVQVARQAGQAFGAMGVAAFFAQFAHEGARACLLAATCVAASAAALSASRLFMRG
ncbi:MFS transporter [Acetobacter tropicalis]|uniref:Putative transport protein n=1 Tax=Acetobacter tropicalis TaxID=104102 RepID=A0A095B092_9PROT|nr:MFS transporter [Acetobacter tropicalis]KAA8390092.1 MFS transporter [Acetobacter tropicalis]KAA8391998.1 MFS transporter [Acetobacter tropicalis]KGB22403.1 putative transport protein [Acetobacter tropicalis]MBC9007658.1 MFS transporter [Acetobacter tropicalis]MDO8172839.1 MFS transporter [Acetobacter tropicalis]